MGKIFKNLYMKAILNWSKEGLKSGLKWSHDLYGDNLSSMVIINLDSDKF